MTELPRTPDFDHWPIEHTVNKIGFSADILSVTWSDGAVSQHHALLLRENSPDPATTHPLAREMAILPADIAGDVGIGSARLEENGAIGVRFSDGTETAYHPGWLRGSAWLDETTEPDSVLWIGEENVAPPSFDGPEALESPEIFLQWLKALRDWGVTRLRGLPQQDGLLEEIVTMTGPVRESNFGRQYVLEIKDDPDSQAYTSNALLQHTDLPTRELPFGLQFLYTRDNSTSGGEGIYTDAYRIAEDMRAFEADHFHSLITDVWEYNNRARSSDYRGSGPVVETDEASRITGIRYNTFLRAPLKAPVDVQARAYKAYRAFCARPGSALSDEVPL